MEKSLDLEQKYNKLALEYSKVRSQATVLKKAVLDEQSKNVELKEHMKDLEQKVRKHDQEMDSLIFRNEQLTKRISVLQQELLTNSHGKKSKNKQSDNTGHSIDFSVIDEELHKKILQNAELVSTMADKDLEITNYKEKVEMLEHKISQLYKEMTDNEEKHNKELDKLKTEFDKTGHQLIPQKNCDKEQEDVTDNSNDYWEQEAERWQSECELLRSKPAVGSDLTVYYESQIRELLELKLMAQSEASSLWAENSALSARLEQSNLEKFQLENSILNNAEELHVTSDNYKSQLDAMTEHLATQNEKITKQCDEIQVLKHRLSLRK